MKHSLMVYLFVLFLILALFSSMALDTGFLFASVMMTMPYVIASQAIIGLKLGAFTTSVLIALTCLTSVILLQRMAEMFGYWKF